MTLKGYFTWFMENWAKAGVIISIFLTIYLVIIVLPQNTLLFALLMSTPLYILHEANEYVFPGGFAQFVNQDIYKMDSETGLLDSKAVFWINVVGVWFLISYYSLGAVSDLTMASWIPYFFIFQAVVHLIIGVIGKRFLNPGMLSAWLIHVPWAVWTIWLLVRAGMIVNPYWNAYLRDGLLINLALPVAGFFLWVRYKRRQPRR